MMSDALAVTVTGGAVAGFAPLVCSSMREEGRGVDVFGETAAPDDVARTTEALPQSSSIMITCTAE